MELIWRRILSVASLAARSKSLPGRGIEDLPGTGEDGSSARGVHSVSDGQIEASALGADPWDQQRHLRTELPHLKKFFGVGRSHHQADVVRLVPFLCLLSHQFIEPVRSMS